MLLLNVDIPLVTDLLIIFCISIILILICSKLKLPSIIGFLLTGVICGTNGVNLHELAMNLPSSMAEFIVHYFPKYIAPPEKDVEMLAEIGVVLLLFTIGLEFSIASLMRIKRAVFLGGSLQVLLTVGAFACLVYFASYDYWPIAILMGMLFTLSSTAIVLKILSEKGEIGKPHGQVVLAILIFQDIAIVPMMLLVPILASGDFSTLGIELLVMGAKAVGVLAIMLLLGKYIIPPILYYIAKAKSNDLFIISIMVICFAIAYITSLAGLSLALGAFMAGLVISETQYGHHAIGSIISFKELFTSIFFISIGLLMDLSFMIAHFGEILFFTILVILLKIVVSAIVVILLKGKLRTVVAVSLGISQVGEFSFVLSKIAEKYGLMPIELYQYFMSVAVLTMIIAPILMNSTDKITSFLLHSKWIPEKLRKWMAGIPIQHTTYNTDETLFHDHLIIIGHDLTAQTIIHGASDLKIPHLLIEDDVQIVREQSSLGVPTIFGSASSEEVLKYAHVAQSVGIIITGVDVENATAITIAIKHLKHDAYIIARTQTLEEATELKKHGVSVILTDEVEMNVAMLVEVLNHLDMSVEDTHRFTSFIKTASGK
jgi:CPA2 family monovalent cation:H+ antiporter-2